MLFLRKNKKNIKDIIKKWDFNKNLKKEKYFKNEIYNKLKNKLKNHYIKKIIVLET